MGEIGGYAGEWDSILDKLSRSTFLPLSVDEKASVDLGVAFVKGGVEAVSEDSRHGEGGRDVGATKKNGQGSLYSDGSRGQVGLGSI